MVDILDACKSLTLCVLRMYIYILAVPCTQPLTYIQTTNNVYIRPVTVYQQPLELSLSHQGLTYTSKIVNFSKHVKIRQQPKEF